MTTVQQYNNYACVAACLESVKKDWGESEFSHEAFIRMNLPLFNGGTEIEGSCDIRRLPEICSRCSLDVEMIVGGALACDTKNEALLAYVHWGADEGQKHFVRVEGCDGETITIMNPQGATIQVIPKAWVQRAYIIKSKKANKSPEPTR